MPYWVALFTFSLVACGPKPEATVKNFFASAQKSDMVSMVNYINKDTNKENFKYTDVNQEKIVKSDFSKVSYVIVSSSKLTMICKMHLQLQSLNCQLGKTMINQKMGMYLRL